MAMRIRFRDGSVVEKLSTEGDVVRGTRTLPHGKQVQFWVPASTWKLVSNEELFRSCT